MARKSDDGLPKQVLFLVSWRGQALRWGDHQVMD